MISVQQHQRELGSSIRKLMETDPAFRPVAYFSMEIVSNFGRMEQSGVI